MYLFRYAERFEIGRGDRSNILECESRERRARRASTDAAKRMNGTVTVASIDQCTIVDLCVQRTRAHREREREDRNFTPDAVQIK